MCPPHCGEESPERRSSHTKFKPAVVVRDVMCEDPGQGRKTLKLRAKRKVTQEDNAARLDHLTSLEKQGQMIKGTTANPATIWAKTIQALPQQQMKFALNAALDTLPHNTQPPLVEEERE